MHWAIAVAALIPGSYEPPGDNDEQAARPRSDRRVLDAKDDIDFVEVRAAHGHDTTMSLVLRTTGPR